MTYEAASMIIVDPLLLSDKKLSKSVKNLLSRPILSVFEEVGTTLPSEVSLKRVKPDRRELDRIIMGEVLGLTDDEQLEVYRAVVDLVKSRIEKAKSFGARRRTKKGIDVSAVIETVLNHLDGRSLSAWYQKHVLVRDDLRTKKLPKSDGAVTVEKSLFGWQLNNGKAAFPCESEQEARYLKVWIEAGVNSIKIPRDKSYLARIATSLTKEKAEIDATIESHLSSILDFKLKSYLLHQIWQKIV